MKIEPIIEVMVVPFFAATGACPGVLSTPSDPLLLILSDAGTADASAAVVEDADEEGSAAAAPLPASAVAAVDDLGDKSKAAGIATTADDRRASKFKSSYISIVENIRNRKTS